MYHIAICDDDEEFVEYMKTVLLKAKSNEEQIFKIYEYYSGEEFLWSLEENIFYDLLILDVQLGGIDGNEVAKLFREKFFDSVLVFCSGVYLPTVQCFKVTPFRYLLKSQTNEEFIYEMKEVLKEVERSCHEVYIMGHYRSIAIRVRIRNILYIENAKRGSRIIVHPMSEEAKFEWPILLNKKLEQLSEKLLKLEFAFPHSRYIVNLNHIETISTNLLKLDNGETLTIARSYQKEFKDALAKCIANKY